MSDAEQAELALMQRFEKYDMGSLCGPLALEPDALVKRARRALTRGLNVDHTTVWRWVQYYGPELEQRLRQHLKPTNKSWRVDETYVRVKGRWCYLYRAIDSRGATIDFLLSAVPHAAVKA